jgi:hypothetical protein
MCRRVDCSKCGRPTYSGCGAHVEQVLGGVAPADRCRCREAKEAGREATPAGSAVGNKRRSWLRGLLR